MGVRAEGDHLRPGVEQHVELVERGQDRGGEAQGVAVEQQDRRDGTAVGPALVGHAVEGVVQLRPEHAVGRGPALRTTGPGDEAGPERHAGDWHRAGSAVDGRGCGERRHDDGTGPVRGETDRADDRVQRDAGEIATGSRRASWWLALRGVDRTWRVRSSRATESDRAPLEARVVSSASSQCR